MSAFNSHPQYPNQGSCYCPRCTSAAHSYQAYLEAPGAPPAYASSNETTFSNPTSNILAWLRATAGATTSPTRVRSEDPPAYYASNVRRVDTESNPNTTIWPPVPQFGGTSDSVLSPIHSASQPLYTSGGNASASVNSSHTTGSSMLDHVGSQWQASPGTTIETQVHCAGPVIQDTQIAAVDGEQRTYYIITRVRF